MATTKVKQSTRTLGTGEVAITNIVGGSGASAGTFLKQDGTWSAAGVADDVYLGDGTDCLKQLHNHCGS